MKQKNILKLTAATFAIIGAGTLLFHSAAEAGAQYLHKVFGLDLEGAYVYMSYYSGTETFPRAFWYGDVLFQKERTPESTMWSFSMDAVTGELFDIGYSRQLDVSVSLDYDAAFEKDCIIYAELAKKESGGMWTDR